MPAAQPPRRRLRAKTRPPPTVVAQPPRKRLRVKTPPAHCMQKPLIGVMGLGAEADAKKGRRVYLVTLPHPRNGTAVSGRSLVAPGTMTREQILRAFLDSCAKPMYIDPKSRANPQPAPVQLTGVFRELHAANELGVAEPHDHLPVKAGRDFMYLPVKRALLERHGLASHWSGTHTGYWSPVRYLYFPSPKKPAASLDNAYVLWPQDHPRLDDCCHEPTTAAALEARRVKTDKNAAAAGKPAARITEVDVWPIVVRNNIRNTHDDMNGARKLMAWAVDHASVPMRDFLFKHRSRLNALIDDIWKWENVKGDLAVARLNRIQALQAAAQRPCLCRGPCQWTHYVLESFRANGIDAAELCGTILNVLASGRCESVPVVVLAGARGGEGKSLFLKALFSVFGDEHMFISPEAGSFPLMELPGKKVVFLDDWRFDDEVLSYATQCLWFDGSVVPINQRQNIQGVTGHIQYRGSAPILATSKLRDLQELERLAADDPRTGVPKDTEASMLYRRLKVYSYTHRIAKPPPQHTILRPVLCVHGFERRPRSPLRFWARVAGVVLRCVCSFRYRVG